MRLNQFLPKILVLKLLCLMALLTVLSSCTSKVITKTEYLYPPQAYLVACERTEFNGSTYGDTIEYLTKVMGERDLCANQIESIRKWKEEVSK